MIHYFIPCYCLTAAGGGGFANFADFQNPATQGATTPQQPPGNLFNYEFHRVHTCMTMRACKP